MASMKVKSRLDPNLPLFTAAELAEVSGLSRGIVDLWGSRGLLPPTRRERMPRSAKGRSRKGHGRPMFSVATIFRARLAHDLGGYLGIGLSEWIRLADLIEGSEVARRGWMKRIEAPEMARRGWMEAIAHAIETHTPAKFYVDAAYIGGHWEIEGQGWFGTEDELKEPEFGGAIPYIVIPMSDIFAAVYRECKKLLE